MNSILRFTVSIFIMGSVSACGPTPSSHGIPTTEQQQGIIGGSRVKSGSAIFSHTVGLYNKKSNVLCSGTLITPHAVLTAAHCVPEKTPEQMEITFGANIKKAPKEIVRKVVKTVRHPGYNHDVTASNNADLAIVFFEGDAPKTHIPARLLTDFSVVKEKMRMQVAGYGVAWAWGLSLGAGKLRSTKLEVSAIDFTETEFLVNLSMAGANCNGDSGGPAFVAIKNQLYLAGVSSRSDQIPLLPDCILFSVMTRVDPYIGWIQSVLAEGFVSRIPAGPHS